MSEGSDHATLDALAAAMRSGPRASLLDRTADADHARSVFTLAGEPSDVAAAVEAAIGIAIDRIDMRRQSGQHPRIGAVDVVPYIPLGTTTMDECVALARAFAARIADRFDLPVYLYGRAAARPDRRTLAEIRRPGFEGLTATMARVEGAPDHGPRRPHPTAGATAVGARPFLIAWNIQLETTDVEVARRVAGRIRERDGGLAGIQALGLKLESLACVQVSMNVLDYLRTPLWRVWEEVGALATAAGVAVRDSELIGLMPAAALREVVDHIGVSADSEGRRFADAAAWLSIRDFTSSMVLEVRLAEVLGEERP